MCIRDRFNKFENGSVDATDRTDVLVKQMQDKNRQLIVTTMQKMVMDGPEMFWVLTFSTGLLALSAPGALDLMLAHIG